MWIIVDFDRICCGQNMTHIIHCYHVSGGKAKNKTTKPLMNANNILFIRKEWEKERKKLLRSDMATSRCWKLSLPSVDAGRMSWIGVLMGFNIVRCLVIGTLLLIRNPVHFSFQSIMKNESRWESRKSMKSKLLAFFQIFCDCCINYIQDQLLLLFFLLLLMPLMHAFQCDVRVLSYSFWPIFSFYIALHC